MYATTELPITAREATQVEPKLQTEEEPFPPFWEENSELNILIPEYIDYWRSKFICPVGYMKSLAVLETAAKLYNRHKECYTQLCYCLENEKMKGSGEDQGEFLQTLASVSSEVVALQDTQQLVSAVNNDLIREALGLVILTPRYSNIWEDIGGDSKGADIIIELKIDEREKVYPSIHTLNQGNIITLGLDVTFNMPEDKRLNGNVAEISLRENCKPSIHIFNAVKHLEAFYTKKRENVYYTLFQPNLKDAYAKARASRFDYLKTHSSNKYWQVFFSALNFAHIQYPAPLQTAQV